MRTTGGRVHLGHRSRSDGYTSIPWRVAEFGNDRPRGIKAICCSRRPLLQRGPSACVLCFFCILRKTLQFNAAQRVVDGRCSRRLDPHRARTQAAFRALPTSWHLPRGRHCREGPVQCNTNQRNPGSRLSILTRTRSTPTQPGMQHRTRSPSWRRLWKC